MLSKQSLLIIKLLVFITTIQVSYAEKITLHVPILEDSPKQHEFFYEILSQAFQNSDHNLKLVIKRAPQARVKRLFEKGDISIFWMLESPQRNKKYIPINVNLTKGLIGKRILFIKKGKQHIFDNITKLDDLRKLNLVAGLGQEWLDTQIWEANKLGYKKQPGNWKTIFNMVLMGRYDYFPRGINEILTEAKQHPELAIEKKLVFIYNGKYKFYLSTKGKYAGVQYNDIINTVLKKAEQDGLIKKTIKKYWSNNLKILNYDKRIKIFLEMPKEE